MPKVLIAPSTLAKIGGAYVDTLKAAGFELVYPPHARQLKEDELLQVLTGCVGSLAGSEPYTRKVIESHPQLRVIARVGVGYDAVDVPAATDHKVAVTITPGANQDAVAEHTLCVLLALAKDLITQHVQTRAGKWPRFPTLPLRGKVLGIAGLGRIGKAVAVRARAFDMKLIAYEPFPDPIFVEQHGIKLLPFDDLLKESDFVTLHVPLSAESKYVMNRAKIGLMKPTAYLVNSARGGLINEADLVAALKEKKIAGAAIDVFEQEPPGDHALFHLDNVIVTAHTAGVDTRSRDDMAAQSARGLVTLSKGNWPEGEVVNEQIRAEFKWGS